MREVIIVAVPDGQLLDVVGPMEVFEAANELGAEPAYQVRVVSLSGGPLRTSGRLVIGTEAIATVQGDVDTTMVAGGDGTIAARRDPATVTAVAGLAARSRRITSVCTGAFVLAATGALDGRRATTHWAYVDSLARSHPNTEVDPDAIYVHDGPVWTSAGVTAGIDLALALVADDHGTALAREVARWLVVYLQRPGGQSQFSAHLAAGPPGPGPIAEVVAWVSANFDGDCSVSALATHASMSERHFARVFSAELGVTPAAHVEGVRVEAVRRQLETTTDPLALIAGRCGFGTVATMHRALQRAVGVSPGAYRDRFGPRP